MTGRPSAICCAVTTAERATIDPSDRSMPAAMMTNVMPTATTELVEASTAIVRSVATDKKSSDSSEKSTRRPARATPMPPARAA